MFDEFGINAGYVEDLHALYLQSPQAVDEKWRLFFEQAGQAPAPTQRSCRRERGPMVAPALAPALARLPTVTNGRGALKLDLPHDTVPPSELLVDATAGGKVYALINAYRVRGHLYARLNPLSDEVPPAAELSLENYGLSSADLDLTFPTLNVGGLPEKATLRTIIAHLEETYCRSIGVEFTQIESPEMRLWLRERMESSKNHLTIDTPMAVRVLSKLTDAEAFEQFLAKNFVGEKRFSCEGAESLIAMLDVLIEESGENGVDEIIFGMAHRGRLKRARQHAGQEGPRDLRGVRRQAPRPLPRRRRREIPPGLLERRHHAVGQQRPPDDVLQPEPPRVREPGGRGPRPRQAGPHPTARASCPCSSTATRPSWARAWSPRR